MNVYVTHTHGPHIHVYVPLPYGISTLPQITRLFCRISSLFQGSFTKEPYDASRLRDAVDETESVPMGWLR